MGRAIFLFGALIAANALASRARASSDAPAWLHNLTNVSLPEHDEKTEAILLYSEENVTVQPNGKIRRVEREAYKILRPGGSAYSKVVAYSNPQIKILSMRGWCIPASGKDYEVKDKDAVESSALAPYAEYVTDVRAKILSIPDPEPGNVVGSEVETEESVFVLEDTWDFQQRVPVREAHYTLSLPAGWEYRAKWMNASEVKPSASGTNSWQWTVNDVKEIRHEPEMPPWYGVAGRMIASFIPPNGVKQGFVTWTDVARWSAQLAQGRRDPSPEIKQKVAELTAGKADTAAKMQALADFLQRDIRYVGIELGIGGWQPHPAADIYKHRYGDCKDKATLLSAMLKEIGVDSDYVFVNMERGVINADTPPQRHFNHAILGIRLPDDVKGPLLEAIYVHPTLGRILIFDPTDELTPLGSLRGPLQGNYGLLLTPQGGDLVELPVLPSQSSGIRRSGQLTLSANGALIGEVTEWRVGDAAMRQRYAYQQMQKKEDRIKPIETMLAQSFASYQITKLSIGNLDVRDQPFQFQYAFVVPSYAKTAGELLLVRPRVIGQKSSDVLEKKEPRKYPVEFEGPHRDNDRVEIALPQGYQVDELPPAVDADYPFGSYHSKTEVKGGAIVYTRVFEIKQVSVPLEQMDDLKKFYRIIASDERNTAVLKPAH